LLHRNGDAAALAHIGAPVGIPENNGLFRRFTRVRACAHNWPQCPPRPRVTAEQDMYPRSYSFLLSFVVGRQVFAEFDTDGSGFLDYEEFSRMLPEMGIYLPPTKVVRPSLIPLCWPRLLADLC
jgi:hypothetical protein